MSKNTKNGIEGRGMMRIRESNASPLIKIVTSVKEERQKKTHIASMLQ